MTTEWAAVIVAIAVPLTVGVLRLVPNRKRPSDMKCDRCPGLMNDFTAVQAHVCYLRKAFDDFKADVSKAFDDVKADVGKSNDELRKDVRVLSGRLIDWMTKQGRT